MKTNSSDICGFGGSVVMHASLTATSKIRFLPLAAVNLNFPMSIVRQMLSKLTLPGLAH